MLDIRYIRKHNDAIHTRMRIRNQENDDLDFVTTLDVEKRTALVKLEEMKASHNQLSLRIRDCGTTNDPCKEMLINEAKSLSSNINQLSEHVKSIDLKLEKHLLAIPNIPCEDTPLGFGSEQNVVLRTVGEVSVFSFEPKSHWEIGEKLGFMDFETATKIAGTRFVVLKGTLAKLERALTQFMMDIHTSEGGFEELVVPHLVNRDSMTGTGQLPKFEADMYHCPEQDLFLIPTAEVPLINLYRDLIIDESNLPILNVACTPCYRKEAGASGQDSKGLIRMHQFNKVELIGITSQETSNNVLEHLTISAEKILKTLELPYRVVRLCGGELGFSANKTFDLEVWLPSQNQYKEIASCSSCGDFQSRRSSIRYRDNKSGKLKYTHTLNASGVAIGRTMAAILENHQNPDGTVTVPLALRPYMGGIDLIKF